MPESSRELEGRLTLLPEPEVISFLLVLVLSAHAADEENNKGSDCGSVWLHV